MVYEKPFGTSPASFRCLDRVVHSVLDEQQVYRIDHFLGKEATQDLHLLRFANGLFDAMWNREHVESVQIDVPEKLGITDRSVFYDATGAVLDMLVTHLFQVAAEVAMEPPASLGALDLQAAREKVIKSFRPLDPAEVVLGQFTGYRSVPGVAAKSSQNTFVAARLWIDNPRWRGVPFYLRTGKRLAETKQRVSLILREPPGPLAGQLPGEANVLSFSLAGDGEIDLSLVAKRPGPRPRPGPRHRRGPAVPPARRGPAAAVRPADPRRPDRRPVAVHPPGRAGRGVEGGRAAAVEPASGRVLRAGLVGAGRGAQAHRAGPVAAGAVMSEAQLTDQGGVIPEDALGADPGAVEADDGDGQHLGPAEGRLDPRQQPGQLPVVGERHRGLVHQPPPVHRPGDRAQRQVGGQVREEPGRRRSARRPAPGRAGHGRDVRDDGLGGQLGEGRLQVAAPDQGLLVLVPGLRQVPHELGDGRGHGYRPTRLSERAWFPPCLTLTHPR